MDYSAYCSTNDDDDDNINIAIMRNEDVIEEGDEDEDQEEEEEEEESQLPGFRFYPTDEELVDFYLRRKVENKPFTLDLIKEFDIYKYDPWALPSMFSSISSIYITLNSNKLNDLKL